jgi:hypothetical protein
MLVLRGVSESEQTERLGAARAGVREAVNSVTRKYEGLCEFVSARPGSNAAVVTDFDESTLGLRKFRKAVLEVGAAAFDALDAQTPQ